MKRKDLSVAVLIVTLVAMAAVGPASGMVRDVLADTRILPPQPGTAAPLGEQTGPGVALQGGLGNGASVEAGGGGSFSVGIQADPAGLDPAVVWDTSSHLVTSQIYETLVNVEAGGSTPVPGLAESWSVSLDGLTWTFTLRGGVTFQDGSNLNAAAVAYNIERWWDPAHPFHDGSFDYFSTLFGGFKGDSSCLLSDIDTNGTTQVLIILTKPFSPLPSMLAMPAFGIASPTAIQTGSLATAPVGTGPFEFVVWVAGTVIVLEDNPAYWGQGPHLDTLVFRVIPDDDDRFVALQGNTVQSVGDLPPSYSAQVATDPNLRGLWRDSIAVGYLGINRSHTPLDEPLVQQAIAHAINRQALLDDYYAAGDQVADQFLPPAVFGYDPDIVDYSYDPILASSLLTLAGYPGGFATTLGYRDVFRTYLPNPAETAAAIKDDLLAIGIDATVIQYESNEFINKWVNGELDIFLIGWTQDYAHPDDYFRPILCDTYLGFGPKDDELCSQLEVALEEMDFDDQLSIYKWASRRVHDTLPLLPIVHPRTLLAMRYNVFGLVPSIGGSELFKDVWIATSWTHLPLVAR
jgi:peptide/nickel transport system substrate-binding protein